jgi:hypothetical protein
VLQKLMPLPRVTGSRLLREGAGPARAMLFPNLKSGVGRVYTLDALVSRRIFDMTFKSGIARDG